MIKDRLSVALVASSVLISCHLYGILGDAIFIPMFLPIAGIALNHYISGTQPTVDDDYLTPSGKRSMVLIVLGVLSLGIFGVIGQNLSIVENLSIIDAGLCVTLIAIGETMFFQGCILPYLLTLIKWPIFGILGSSAIFMGYHNWVYGADPATMGYVFFAGVILAYVCHVTKRLWPTMVIHILNNLIATM